MNRPFKPVAPAGVSSPSPIVGTPATPSPAAHLANTTSSKLAPASDRPCFGVGASFLCPQCDSPLSDRITDEDTQMSYPCDDGEGFCEQCDSIWTDAELIESPAPRNLPTMEEVQSKIAEVFGPTGWAKAEAAALRRQA